MSVSWLETVPVYSSSSLFSYKKEEIRELLTQKRNILNVSEFNAFMQDDYFYLVEREGRKRRRDNENYLCVRLNFSDRSTFYEDSHDFLNALAQICDEFEKIEYDWKRYFSTTVYKKNCLFEIHCASYLVMNVLIFLHKTWQVWRDLRKE